MNLKIGAQTPGNNSHALMMGGQPETAHHKLAGNTLPPPTDGGSRGWKSLIGSDQDVINHVKALGRGRRIADRGTGKGVFWTSAHNKPTSSRFFVASLGYLSVLIIVLIGSSWQTPVRAQSCLTSNFTQAGTGTDIYVVYDPINNQNGLDHAHINSLLNGSGLSYTAVINNASNLDQAVNNGAITNLIENAQIFVTNNGNPSAVIQNEIFMDQDLHFRNCKIIFEKGTGMEILGGVNVKFDNCIIKGGCDDELWDGITVNGSSSPNTRFEVIESQIWDMASGVTLTGSPEFICVRSRFVNNWLSLLFKDCNYATFGSSEFRVADDTFKTEGRIIKVPTGSGTNSKARQGIETKSCKYVRIGEFGHGNLFEDLQSGVTAQSPMISNTNYKTEVLNCKFKDISGQKSDLPFLEYSSSDTTQLPGYVGSAISAFGASDKNLSIVVRGQNANDATITDVQKAITINQAHCEVTRVSISNAAYGVVGQITGRDLFIQGSNFNPVFYGIYLKGYPSQGSFISNNNIYSPVQQTLQYGLPSNDPLPFPEGIYLEYPAGNTAGGYSWEISNNLIEMKARKGNGIRLLYGKGGLVIKNNEINLNPAPRQANDTLRTNQFHSGIYCLLTDNSVEILENNIKGNSHVYYLGGRTKVPRAKGNPTAGEATGVQLNTSNCIVACNSMDQLVNGISIRGNCDLRLNGGNHRVRGNRFYETNLGIVFRTKEDGNDFYRNYLGYKIGDELYDCANRFNGSGSNYDLYPGQNFRAKVLTLRDLEAGWNDECGGTYERKIYASADTSQGTNLWFQECQSAQEPGNSNSPNTDLCKYNLATVPDPSMIIFNCSGTSNGNRSSGLPLVDSSSIKAAESVARDTSLPSLLFPATRWLAAKSLFESLNGNPDALGQSTVLDSFYNSLLSSSYYQIYQSEQAYAALGDSAVYSDALLMQQAYQALAQAASAIGSNTSFDQNEQYMLLLYGKVHRFGIDSLTTSERQDIHDMAYSCELVAGSAVHKARYLYGYFSRPVDFEELDICGAYAAANQGATSRMAQVDKGVCRVSPNPATDRINIGYQLSPEVQSAILEIRDAMGALVIRNVLPTTSDYYSVDLYGLRGGIYYYRVQADGVKVSAGKFIKQD